MTASRHHAGLSTVDSKVVGLAFPSLTVMLALASASAAPRLKRRRLPSSLTLLSPGAARLGAGTLALASARWVRVPGQARQARPQPAAGRASGDAAQRRGLPAPDRFRPVARRLGRPVSDRQAADQPGHAWRRADPGAHRAGAGRALGAGA